MVRILKTLALILGMAATLLGPLAAAGPATARAACGPRGCAAAGCGPRGCAAGAATRPAYRAAPVYRHPVYRPPGVVVVNPQRYWAPGGAVAAGAAIGFIAGAAAVSVAGAAPKPGYCWYYTNPQKTTGFWDVCP